LQKLTKKRTRLTARIKKLESLIVAFSGGIDSTFLSLVSHEVLGNKLVAVTADSPIHPSGELEAAISFAKEKGIRHVVIQPREMDVPGFTANTRDRCYICKKNLFRDILEKAADLNIHHVAHGANLDDLSDYRPGQTAAEEMGIIAPLVEAEMTKNDIRRLAREMKIKTWDKPAMACLATRIPYGAPITREALGMVDRAESVILNLGFRSCRVRHHGDMARIEIDRNDLAAILRENTREKIVEALRTIGFLYVSVDLEGYATGSLNRLIHEQKEDD